jgi:protein-S-isoprenylcysteine O-methyltransferase Ste14
MLRNVPPPLWALLLLAGTYFLSEAPGLRDLPQLATRPAGAIILLAALALVFASMLQFFFANTQLLPTSETNNALVTGGIFALTRNPMYLGMVIFCIGGALWVGRPLMLLAPLLMFAVANRVFIPFEEAKMRRQFGEAFDAYCQRVRRWI